MYKSYIIVYIQLVDICSTQNKKQESIHTEIEDENKLIKQCCAYTHSTIYKL